MTTGKHFVHDYETISLIKRVSVQFYIINSVIRARMCLMTWNFRYLFHFLCLCSGQTECNTHRKKSKEKRKSSRDFYSQCRTWPYCSKTFTGECCFMNLISDFCRFTKVRLLNHKSKSSWKYKVFLKTNAAVRKSYMIMKINNSLMTSLISVQTLV